MQPSGNGHKRRFRARPRGVEGPAGSEDGPGPDEDLAGAGDESDHLGLAAVDEGEIEPAQGGVSLGGAGGAAEGGHEEGGAGEGAALGNLGLAYAALGRVEEAVGYYEQALAIRREIRYRRGEGNDLGNLGIGYKQLGRLDDARRSWQEALRNFTAIKSPNAQRVRGLPAGLGPGGPAGA